MWSPNYFLTVQEYGSALGPVLTVKKSVFNSMWKILQDDQFRNVSRNAWAKISKRSRNVLRREPFLERIPNDPTEFKQLCRNWCQNHKIFT
jgi:hypothetical protein